jgi:beta-phosphoglucomutase-like phosphatase (HAD superfamily)
VSTTPWTPAPGGVTSHLPTVGFDAFNAWRFDLDGVLTDTAEAHAAWKSAFDPVLAEESERRTSPVAAFDPVDDYICYVDGRPRADGVRTFLDARGIRLGEGHPGDGPSTRTVWGIANGKNDLVRHILDMRGVRVFPGAVTLLHALHALHALQERRVRTSVVSASENTGAVLRPGGIGDLIDVCVVGVEAGRSGRFGLVVGVDHGGQAAELVEHGADVVVSCLADLVP